mgnify:CR=1 FL=1
MAVTLDNCLVVAISSRALFGSCLYILEEVLTRYGVKVTFVDGADLDQWRAAVTPGTKAVFFESMSNPTLELVDIRSVAEIAHAVGALVIVDNVFATPIFSRAVEQGADVIVYSTTKHIDGQGRALGGVICGREEFIRKTVETYMKHTGGSMSPFTAWMHLNGMATLDLRCRAMAQSAAAIATYKIEPYVLAADVYGMPPHEGRGGWSWYTGSAGWMYRLIVESLLGLQRNAATLRLQPVLPIDWPGFNLDYRFGATLYRIEVLQQVDAVPSLQLDGVLIEGGEIPLADDGQDHRVELHCRPR